jgi:1-acyl-sn-glycerol-3-phosphate acyltransferase
LNFTRVSTRGAEHVERGRAYIVMSNHQSQFDVLATASRSPVPVRWVMKEELRRVPILGPACAKVGMVFIDRRDRGRAIASLRAPSTRAMVGRGISLFFFPEGTRSSDGQLGSFKKGGFMAALELGLPILPMTISGSGRVLPARGLRILPGSITLTIHPPVMASDYGLERRDELMRDVRAAIAAGLREQQ